jgi:hypothetical protein
LRAVAAIRTHLGGRLASGADRGMTCTSGSTKSARHALAARTKPWIAPLPRRAASDAQEPGTVRTDRPIDPGGSAERPRPGDDIVGRPECRGVDFESGDMCFDCPRLIARSRKTRDARASERCITEPFALAKIAQCASSPHVAAPRKFRVLYCVNASANRVWSGLGAAPRGRAAPRRFTAERARHRFS